MLKSNRTVNKDQIEALDLARRIQIESQITDDRSQSISFTKFQQIETDWQHYRSSRAWRRYVAEFFGGLENKVILDVACGYSMTPVIFALAGATVHAVDVAPKTIATVQQFAEDKGVGSRVHTHVCPAEQLPLADESVDLIFGGAALHHLQLDRAAAELARVLKPGGKGAFQEPLGHNLLLEWARDYFPYSDKHPVKGTDRPLRIQDIERFGQSFATCTYQGFDLFSMVARPFPRERTKLLRQGLAKIDMWLFNHTPMVQRYARFAVICVTK